MTQWPIKNVPGTPLYKVVENFLQEQITAGELAPGDLIPSEPQLAKHLSVSIGTVRKAIENSFL